MSEDNLEYRASIRLGLKADAAYARGDFAGAAELAGAAYAVWWQECLADYYRDLAERGEMLPF